MHIAICAEAWHVKTPAGGEEGGEDTGARALKRPRLVWTPKLHQCFVEAVEQLGVKNAVPKTIMQARRTQCFARRSLVLPLSACKIYLRSTAGPDGLSLSVHLFWPQFSGACAVTSSGLSRSICRGCVLGMCAILEVWGCRPALAGRALC
jgi:SHAQKYF class myb-like DNA-binding protein